MMPIICTGGVLAAIKRKRDEELAAYYNPGEGSLYSPLTSDEKKELERKWEMEESRNRRLVKNILKDPRFTKYSNKDDSFKKSLLKKILFQRTLKEALTCAFLIYGFILVIAGIEYSFLYFFCSAPLENLRHVIVLIFWIATIVFLIVCLGYYLTEMRENQRLYEYYEDNFDELEGKQTNYFHYILP